MIHRSYIESPFDGLRISLMAVVPDIRPKAVLFIIHGICGKKERFLPFMKHMTEKGYACVAHDHRGHGESLIEENDRGYSYKGRSDAIIQDMTAVAVWIKRHFPDIPVYMLGHSMGSLAARAFVREDDRGLDGLILCGSPSYNPMSKIGLAMVRIIGLFKDGRIRSPLLQNIMEKKYNKRFEKEGEKAWTCSDHEVLKAVKADPECNFDLTADYSAALMELMGRTYSTRGWRSSNNMLPILFLAGEDDPCIISRKKFLKAVDSMRAAGYADVSYRLFPKMRHEVLNEVGKEKVWEEIAGFIRV